MAIKTITITEDIKTVVNDILTKAYLTGQARELDGASYKQASNMQGSNADEDRRQIIRSVNNAFTSLKTQLAEFLREDNTAGDNAPLSAIDNDERLVLVFSMPSNYNPTAVDGLANGIHAYLVSMSLAEWFSITSKAEAETYISQTALNLTNIKRALLRRRRPERPTY